MKNLFFLFVTFALLGTLSGTIAQTREHKQALNVDTCDGIMYSVAANATLGASWREKENWTKLVQANPAIKTRWTEKQDTYEYSVIIIVGDVVCIPTGTVVADFINNGSFKPTLVLYNKENHAAIMLLSTPTGQENERPWFENPISLLLFFLFVGLLVVGLFYYLTVWKPKQNPSQTPTTYPSGYFKGR